MQRLMVSALFLGALGAAARAAQPLPPQFMPLAEVRPGMVGEGRTVFHGYKVEPFQVEILGIENNYFAGGSLILARIAGPMLENHGVVAGMSGSPIFIDGRLIGALAYGWSFAYKPICGITPIEQMWSVWQTIGVPELSLPGARPAARRPTTEAWDWQAAWDAHRARLEGQADPAVRPQGFKPSLPELRDEPGELIPLQSPLLLSRASPAVERRIRNLFAARGIEVLSAGSLAGSAPPGTGEPAPPFESGSAMGVPLLSGDLSLSAIGTVTYVEGDRMLAFGHPLFNEGGTNAPLAAAYIFSFMQSYNRSFKLGEVREERGTIEQDRLFAIGGRIGPTPPRVPILVEVAGPAAARPRTYRFSCWQNHLYVPDLTPSAMLEAFASSVAEGGRLSAQTEYTIELADGRRIRKRLFESADGLPILDAAAWLQRDLMLLYENPFHEADVRSIEIRTRVEPGLRQDSLIQVLSDRSAYRAGETVRLTARIQPWRGDEYTRVFDLRLPDQLLPGSYVIHIADRSGRQRIAQMRTPGRFDPRSFEDVVALVRELDFPADELWLYLFEPDVGLDLQGNALAGLPATVQELVRNSASPAVLRQSVGRELLARPIAFPSQISGTQSLLIQVVDHFNE